MTEWWFCYECQVVYWQPTTGYMSHCGCGAKVYPYYRQDLQVLPSLKSPTRDTESSLLSSTPPQHRGER